MGQVRSAEPLSESQPAAVARLAYFTFVSLADLNSASHFRYRIPRVLIRPMARRVDAA